jgi:hypothetical protein
MWAIFVGIIILNDAKHYSSRDLIYLLPILVWRLISFFFSLHPFMNTAFNSVLYVTG